jgi:hypothetical protein
MTSPRRRLSRLEMCGARQTSLLSLRQNLTKCNERSLIANNSHTMFNTHLRRHQFARIPAILIDCKSLLIRNLQKKTTRAIAQATVQKSPKRAMHAVRRAVQIIGAGCCYSTAVEKVSELQRRSGPHPDGRVEDGPVDATRAGLKCGSTAPRSVRSA